MKNDYAYIERLRSSANAKALLPSGEYE